MKAIRVLHIVRGLDVGGLEMFVINLCRHMPEHVHPMVLCLQEKGSLDGQLDGLKVFELNAPEGFNAPTLLRVAKFIKEKKVDILHSHNIHPHMFAVVSGFFTGRPVIHTKHGRNYPGRKRRLLLNRVLAYGSRRVVAVSSDAAAVCTELEGVSPKKVVTILNGVDTDTFRPGGSAKLLEDELDIPAEIFKIGIVARLSGEKDHKTLLKAAEIVSKKGAEFRLILIGDGPLRKELEEFTESFGLGEKVCFAGQRGDVAELLGGLDVFTLSSITEGLSLTLLEAMACQVPVVATDVGGNSEAVGDGIGGFIVPAQNPEAIAEKLLTLYEDKELRARMGAAGRERVCNRFSMEKTAKEYLELYEAACRR